MQIGDTIAAISSAVGEECARMIVRLSGPKAMEIARAVLHFDGELEPSRAARRRLRFRVFPDFPGWIYYFQSPHSLTGENVLELHLPGNVLLAKLIVDDLIRAGARHAEPGEFTARAFFNGKIDLTEAEGVAAIVSAHSQAELDAGRRLLAGELARRLSPVIELIAQTLALVEAGIDFADEGISFLADELLATRIDEIVANLRALLDDSPRIERLSHHPRVVLAGRPNAGKSTLLNALAGFDRAVVSDIAGTTRDALSATVRLRRGMIQLIDLAGLDLPDQSEVARKMHQTALRAIETADAIVLVHDCTDARPPIDLPRAADLRVESKSDLLKTSRSPDALAVSAVSGEGIDELRSQLDELCFDTEQNAAAAGVALTARHVRAIEDAVDSLKRARAAMRAGAELIALELRESLDGIGSILGQVTPDDVLGKIFASFCIGK